MSTQADGHYEAAQAEYHVALNAAAHHRHRHKGTVAFIQERIFQCYAALGDWDALKMQSASPQVLLVLDLSCTQKSGCCGRAKN